MMSKSAEQVMNPGKGEILINAESFVTLLEHVFSHESAPVLEPFCVGGVLLGNIIGEDVAITDVVPFFHGTQEQMEFVENYQNALQFVKGRTGKLVGWYISRMNEHGEFTPNNIQTHQLFQHNGVPKGISLIILPKSAQNLPITLTAYRFADLQKMTQISEIKTIQIIVQPPESTQIYQRVQRIIENSQSFKPIHEIEVAQSASTLKSPVQYLVSSGQSTIPLLKIILEIVKILYQGLNLNAGKLLASMNAVIRNMQSGFTAVMQGMEAIMKEESQHILDSVEQNFVKVHADGDYLATSMGQLTDKLSMDFGSLLKSILEPKLKEFKDNLVEIVEESADIGQKIEMFTDSVKGQQKTLETFKESLETDTSSVEEGIQSLKKRLDEKFIDTKKTSVKSIEHLSKQINEIEESLSKIEKMMKD